MLEEKDIKTYSSNARHQYEVQKGRVNRKTSRDKKCMALLKVNHGYG